MHRITGILPASPAARVGLDIGHCIVSVNGKAVRDIIDWKHALAAPVMRIVARDMHECEQTYIVKHESGADIGLEFESPTIDRLHTCQNNCVFCFVRQMPKGQRDTLYVKDDDYRLSLVYGSFVSLTNIDAENWQRLLSERISPIYVSVHSTNPGLRAYIMQNPRAAAVMEQIKELVSHGIAVHAQLVLVPGLNDGPELIQSLRDLTALYPGVESVAVVPVGLTGYRSGLTTLSGFDANSARTVLREVTEFGKRMRRKHGVIVVHAADEFYVVAHADFPRHTWYDGYPQLENGVGLCRSFIDDFRGEWARGRRKRARLRPVTWVTGESAEFVMRSLQQVVNRDGGAVDLVVARNKLFGGQVTVTGLLGGEDIKTALETALLKPNTTVLIPDVCLRAGSFLDGVTFSELSSHFPQLVLIACATQGKELARITEEE
ncbi:MAG: hypothetical protein DDT20_00500 [Firmicutes bacterium]|nr:hypothetical protein [Bacillota bacterium]